MRGNIIKPGALKHSARGFTLIEVLIAFLIVSMSATIIFDQLHVIQLFSLKAQSKQRQITQALNDATLFYTNDMKIAIIRNEKDRIIITPDPSKYQKTVEVTNYAYEGVNVPPAEAFSPYQYFDFGGTGKFKLKLLQPGLLPANAQGTGVKLK